jgi:hypothetical protein
MLGAWQNLAWAAWEIAGSMAAVNPDRSAAWLPVLK